MKFRVPCRVWAQPATCLVLLTLCAAQATADIVATDRWDAYVADLQSRLAAARGLIPWESTLQSGDARTDANWRLFKIGWVVPQTCVIFAKDGVVGALIDFPRGTTLRLLDPERPDQLPEPRGIDFTPINVRSTVLERGSADVIGDGLPSAFFHTKQRRSNWLTGSC